MLVRRDSWFAPQRPSSVGLEQLFAPLLEAFHLPMAKVAMAIRPPAVDVREEDDGYVVVADVPGLVRAELTIEFQEDTLTLAGSWRTEKTIEVEDAVHRQERQRGEFRRELRFAKPIAADGVAAELSEGVLTVRLPKAPDARKRAIDIAAPEPENG